MELLLLNFLLDLVLVQLLVRLLLSLILLKLLLVSVSKQDNLLQLELQGIYFYLIWIILLK